MDEAGRGIGTARAVLEATIGETPRFARARSDFRAFVSGDTQLALHGEDAGGRLPLQVWRDETAAILARGVQAREFPAELDVQASADVLCAKQLGVIHQMRRGSDPSLTISWAHLEAACRILLGGVTSSAGVSAAS